MDEAKKPRVMILENNQKIIDHVEKILIQAGWETRCQGVSKTALAELENSFADPFALFISNYRLPFMEGDDVLQKARAIAPRTQRLIMVPADNTEILINAINKAGIHASITLPFRDQELVDHAQRCLARFLRIMKRERLKRVTSHQNQQMFRIAQKLKKKDAGLATRIHEKKTRKRILEKEAELIAGTLTARFRRLDIPMLAEACHKEWAGLENDIIHRFSQIASIAGLSFPPPLPGPGEPLPDRQKKEAGSINEPEDAGQASLVKKILETVFISSPGHWKNSLDPSGPSSEGLPLTQECLEETELDGLFKVMISQDLTRAHIQKLKQPEKAPTLPFLLDYLAQKQISYGILPDEQLDSWLKHSGPGDKPFLVAEGTPPIPGRDGGIVFNFKTDYTNPGKIQEDGSIDFRDRGKIPQVSKGDLLAVKTPAREGSPGISVSGSPIPVDAGKDPLMKAMANTRVSEDGLSVFADISGQPHLDVMGQITVNPEFVVNGDVNFQTGNIDFNGNIIVKGIVKEGFFVKGVNLTAQEIHGANVDITGDLCIVSGITDAQIRVHGDIHAKFIHKSSILAFGDLTVQKEIIDSDILLGGCCLSPTGHIISSRMAARGGIEAGRIGTDASKPSHLRVGVDDHADRLAMEIDQDLEKSKARIMDIREKIKSIEEQDQELYAVITDKAQVQEKAVKEIQTLKSALVEMNRSNNRSGVKITINKIEELSRKEGQAEKELDRIFSIQDRYADQLDALKQATERLEQTNRTMVLKKQQIRQILSKQTAKAMVTVNKSITQGTITQGPNSSLTLRNDESRCLIWETRIQDDLQTDFQMTISKDTDSKRFKK